MAGRVSRRPVATITERRGDRVGAPARRPLQRRDEAHAVGGIRRVQQRRPTPDVARRGRAPRGRPRARPAASLRSSSGETPSRVRKPCERSVAALRGRPASTTSTRGPRAPEVERRRQAGRPAADDDDVDVVRRGLTDQACASPCGGSAAMIGWSFADDADLRGAAGRADVVEELDVGRVVVLPLVGQVVLVVDRLDRAHRLARAAVHALVRVDVERSLALVDAVHRALVDARAVLHIDARQRDDVGHDARSERRRARSPTCSSRGTTLTRSRACAVRSARRARARARRGRASRPRSCTRRRALRAARATSPSARPARGSARPRIGDQVGDRLHRVGLGVADEADGSALDPAGRVEAGDAVAPSASVTRPPTFGITPRASSNGASTTGVP